ncbi:MAG: transport system ATP-binding/permease protein [Blastocatellia bacterium]
MTLECPKCKSSIARDGQKFCYRCGNDLREYYAALNIEVKDPALKESKRPAGEEITAQIASAASVPPQTTQVLGSQPTEATVETEPAAPAPKAMLRVLLPTGDAYDRELAQTETQIGKGPRNDLVIADPAVSTAHAAIRAGNEKYTISDLGSRNGTFVNGKRLTQPQPLQHGDVISIGLSKLTFRLAEANDTSATLAPDRTLVIQRGAPPPLTEEALANALTAAGLVSQADIAGLRNDGRGRRLYNALIEDRLVSELGLRDLMSRTFQLPTIDLQSAQVDQAVAVKLPARLAREHQMIAVGKEGDETILAVADPTDVAGIEEAQRELGSNITLRLATPSAIFEQIDRLYGPRLIAVLPTGERVEYFVSQPEMEIGKASHNHIVLNDPTVSNTHAMLLARDGGYSIVDLGSRNGTFVNGERLGTQSHTLRHGNAIQLGQTVLTFRNRAETVANTTATLAPDTLDEIRRRAAQMDTSAEKEMAAASVPSPQAYAQVDNTTPPAFAAPRLDAAMSGAEAAAKAKESDDEKEEKKKKKKKKGGDERLKAAYIGGLSRILAQVFAVVLSVGLALYITQRNMTGDKPKIETSKKGKIKPPKIESGGSGTAFQGGSYEASGVVAVPGTEGVLIVDDNRPGEVLWMQVNDAGQQSGDVKVIPLGTTVEDPEGITTDGSYFYIIGSQSKLEAGKVGGLVRFTFDAASQTVTKAETISGLREFLIENVPELKSAAGVKAQDGGLNIEGIAWDPDPEHRRLLLGLRSPQVNNNALIVTLKMRDPNGPFTIENMQLAVPNALQLPLGGMGIRDIQYDSRLKAFLIISGAPEHHEKTNFTLWEWNGDADQSNTDARPREETTLDMKMKPEGVSRVRVGGKEFIFIVGDSSSYSKFDYNEEPAP